jgi:hypothetical protein
MRWLQPQNRPELEALGRSLFDPVNMPKTEIPVVSYRWGPVRCQCYLKIALKKLIRNNQGLERSSKITVAGGNSVVDGSLITVDCWR